LNIRNYKSLCKLCDKILLSKKSTFFTHSITSLHVLKEHPVLLNDYFKFVKLKKIKKKFIIKKFFSYFANFFLESKNYEINKNVTKKCDVLLFSNLINLSNANKVNDFYYGDIEKKLNTSGIKTRTVLRNFTDKNSKFINKIITKNKILLTKRTNFLNEILIIFRLISEYFYLKKNFYIPKIPTLKNSFLSFLSLRSMISNLRLFYQIEELIQKVRPKLIIIPFEGHAWERLIIKMLNHLNLNILICSYQFTVTTKYQHSLFRLLKKGYNPDIIFTSGKVTKKQFEINYNCPVKILGSNKFKKLVKAKPKVYKNSNFLIIPEAFYSEIDYLLIFTLKIAKLLPDKNFIFRCHPMINVDEIKNNVSLPKNVQFSFKSLSEDINACKFVLFRGSAAVFETVMHGLKPIYLDIKHEPNINPFKDCFSNKYNVVNPEDIFPIIREYKVKKIENKIIKYANEYFTKIDINQIKSLL
jgi:hypothetical protein